MKNKAENAYSALARIYEDITICDYEKWSQYLYALMKKFVQSGAGIDAGCGTGFFTRQLCGMGYKMSAFDKSPQILAVAEQKANEHDLNIFFTQQDAGSFKTAEKVSFVTAINDLVNYLSPSGVLKFFKCAKKALNDGGYLIFDISTPHKLNGILGDNVFAEDTDNFSYIWFNQNRGGYVIMDLTIFIREGNLFRKYDERHIQWAHTQEFIDECLLTAGFKTEHLEDFDSGLSPSGKTQRIFYAARKI